MTLLWKRTSAGTWYAKDTFARGEPIVAEVRKRRARYTLVVYDVSSSFRTWTKLSYSDIPEAKRAAEYIHEENINAMLARLP